MQVKKELSGFKGAACLVEHEGQHYVVSSVDAMYTGPETLVFEADESGNVTSWTDIAGGRGMSREEAIADLEASVGS